MKILLVSLAPFIGGAEVAMERLALGLESCGCNVLCVLGSNNEVGERFSKNGVKWVYMPLPFTSKWNLFFYIYAALKFFLFLKKERFDLLHVNDLPSFQFVSFAAKYLKIPRICHHRYIFNGEAIKWFLKFGVEYHIFVSDALRRDLEEAFPPLKYQVGDVVYDGLPIPEQIDYYKKLQLRELLNLPKDKIIVLFAGQIIYRKGIQDLIQAWKLLKGDLKNKAYLVVIGEDLEHSGSYRKEMERLAEILGVKVDFRGFQKNVDFWLDAVDLVTVPSHIEPLGNATLEAMAHARPVIGTKVGGIPEMIVDGKTGLLVPPKSPKDLSKALATLIENSSLRDMLGRVAYQRCKEFFSIDRHVTNVLRVYNHVISIYQKQ